MNDIHNPDRWRLSYHLYAKYGGNRFKYNNLIKGFEPTSPNRLWVADITYIDTDAGVCYLHLITDAFTHEIIGWVLSESLMATATLDALNQAIGQSGETDLRD